MLTAGRTDGDQTHRSMTDILFLGPQVAFDALVPAAERANVRLYPASIANAVGVLSAYAGVLDGAVLCGGAASDLAKLASVAPRFPVALLNLSVGASEESLGWFVEADAVLGRALSDLAAASAAERGTRPEMNVHPTPSGGWVAHDVLRVSGIAGPRDAADAQRLVEAGGRWHLAVSDVLGRLPEWIALRVRYAAAGGTLSVALVLSAEGETDQEAARRLASAQAHLGPLLQAGLIADGTYVLERARSAGALLVPIRARAVVALRAPEADELAPLFEAGGESWTHAGGTALAEGEADGVSLPVSGPSGALEPLLRLLVAMDAPALVEVVARPAPLSAEERDRAGDLAQRASAMMRTAPWDGPKRLARRAVQLAIESRYALDVRVTVAVEADVVPAALVVEAARALVADPASVSAIPARSEVRGGLLVVGAADPQIGLSGRFAPDEAARTLRLPSPGASVAGLRSVHPARLRSSAALPAVGGVIGHAPDGREVRVSAAMLSTHALVCGATGTGKSTLAATMALELAESGGGLLVLDPHGTLAAQIRDRLPASRRGDLVWIDGGDPEHGHRINLLDYDASDPASRDRVFDDLYAFFDAWYDMKDAGGPMFELHLREAVRLLLHDPTERHALPSLVRMFTDAAYRGLLTAVCNHDETKRFWRDAETRTGDVRIENIGPYIYSKINRLLGSHAVRRMVSSPGTTLDPVEWLRDGAVVLCSLPIGSLGAEGASVVGSVLLSRLIRAGFSRHHAGGTPTPFCAFLDEAQRFGSGSEPAVLMAEGRKVGLGLVSLTQRASSLSPSFREAALANAGLVAALRVGVADASLLAPYLAPTFAPSDLLELGRGEAAVRLQLPDGEPAAPFLLRALGPGARPW